jgi:hypothetical protein
MNQLSQIASVTDAGAAAAALVAASLGGPAHQATTGHTGQSAAGSSAVGIATHLRPDQVSGSWYVYDAIPWASDQVMLFVGQTAKQPASGSPSAK